MAHWFTEITILALCGLALAVFLELKEQRKRDKKLREWAERFAAQTGGLKRTA